MGGHQALVPGLLYLHCRYARGGERLFLPGAYGLPLASAAARLRSAPTVRTWYDRFRADGVWAQAGADLTRRVRQAHGHGAEPTTGILDSQSVVSGPQPGERGFDGNKKIKGIKRHVLSCSLGFVLAVVVTPASVHDTKAAELVLDRAVENGFNVERAKVDAIDTGPTIETVSCLHKVEFQRSEERRVGKECTCGWPGGRVRK